MSLVELLVGITVGLFIVGAATMVVTSQLSDNRLLLLETQLQQDLRASADIVTRELRRSGAWGSAQLGVSYPERPAQAASNPFHDFDADDGGTSITFEYQRGAGAEGPYGFQLSNGVIKTQLAGAGWQDLTDPRAMNVTRFEVTTEDIASGPLPCPRPCADGTTDCWPQLIMRTIRIDIEAQARADSSIRRSIATVVRPRNDEIRFNNVPDVCP